MSVESFDLPLRAKGTAFQKAVWDQLSDDPLGHHDDLRCDRAPRWGCRCPRPGPWERRTARTRCRSSLPCHRVIGADGTLTGYGGGLPRKSALLRIEGVPTERDQLVLFD